MLKDRMLFVSLSLSLTLTQCVGVYYVACDKGIECVTPLMGERENVQRRPHIY